MLQKVYQLCSQIPLGKVSTYKLIALATYGNPLAARAVGNILKKCECKGNFYNGISLKDINEYQCPYKCYRVIRSNFEVGKFIWKGKNQIGTKQKKLETENIPFDKKGCLLKNYRQKVVFKNF